MDHPITFIIKLAARGKLLGYKNKLGLLFLPLKHQKTIMDKIEPKPEDYEQFFKTNPQAFVALETIVFKRLYLEEKEKNSEFEKNLEGAKNAG